MLRDKIIVETLQKSISHCSSARFHSVRYPVYIWIIEVSNEHKMTVADFINHLPKIKFILTTNNVSVWWSVIKGGSKGGGGIGAMVPPAKMLKSPFGLLPLF